MAALVEQYNRVSGVIVVNFWSTWCKPCIDEIPDFIKVVNQWKDSTVQLLLVSQDTKKIYESGKLKSFVSARNWKANMVWLNETDADYYCPMVDSSWSGAIPATLIMNPAKNYRRFFEESLSADNLSAEIKKATGN